VVEDNTINQMVVRWSLEQLGCQVTVADDGIVAIQTLDESRFDMVLMDCEMPGLDGYQTTHRIRLKEDAMQRIPIVAITAHATQGARERCLAAGMDDYLPKPIRRPDLERILGRWIPN
jgi:CheY-like chemotaxis protein